PSAGSLPGPFTRCSSHLAGPSPTSPRSLHDALPIYNELVLPQIIMLQLGRRADFPMAAALSLVLMVIVTLAYIACARWLKMERTDRKSTRLNSSHVKTSYAVFCLTEKPVDVGPDRVG